MQRKNENNIPTNIVLPEFIQSICETLKNGFFYIFLTKDGYNFSQKKAPYATYLINESKKNGKDYALIDLDQFGKRHLLAIDVSCLEAESMRLLTSDQVCEEMRFTYLPFTNIINLTPKIKGTMDEKIAWPMYQTEQAYHHRQEQLKPYMHPNPKDVQSCLIELFDKKLDCSLGSKDIPCLYQLIHQLVIETISRMILGLPNTPQELHAFLDKLEYNVVNSDVPLDLFGMQFSIFPSQTQFLKMKNECHQVSLDYLKQNEEYILNGYQGNQGYISGLLTMFAKELKISREEAFERIEIREKLAAAALGLHFAAGTLSTVVTLGLLHLDKLKEKLQEINITPEHENYNLYVKRFFHEIGRWSASAAHNVRYTTKALDLQLENGETIHVQPNTYIVLSLRDALQNENNCLSGKNFNDNWINESKFSVGSTKFPLFSKGLRQCPGQNFAALFGNAIFTHFIWRNLKIENHNKDAENIQGEFWTNEDFVTRPYQGKTIPITIINDKPIEVPRFTI